MAIYETMDEKNRLQAGTVVWAYAFQENSMKEGMLLSQKPVKGCIIHDSIYSNMFAPFKKNKEPELALSKAINVYGRNFADTEEEAKEGYNQLIEKRIEWYQNKISLLKDAKL